MESEIRSIILEGLEQKVAALNGVRSTASRPARGWLRAIREAIGLTQDGAASAMGVRRQSFAQFEKAEADETISLGSLSRAAAALDCEVVYFLVPKGQGDRTYVDLAAAHDPASAHRRATDHSMDLKGGGPGQ
jgi:predicted DNA-binding mobile mystery protein A